MGEWTMKTRLAWLAAICFLIAYDIAMVACNSTPGDTLSEAVWNITDHRLTFWLGLGLGVVLGHLFWQRKR
jgi:hypothetical protein